MVDSLQMDKHGNLLAAVVVNSEVHDLNFTHRSMRGGEDYKYFSSLS